MEQGYSWLFLCHVNIFTIQVEESVSYIWIHHGRKVTWFKHQRRKGKQITSNSNAEPLPGVQRWYDMMISENKLMVVLSVARGVFCECTLPEFPSEMTPCAHQLIHILSDGSGSNWREASIKANNEPASERIYALHHREKDSKLCN